MDTMSDHLAPPSVLEWAWRTDVLAWRNGWPIYNRSNWAEVVGFEVGDRALEYLYEENVEEIRWPPALDASFRLWVANRFGDPRPSAASEAREEEHGE